MNDKNKNFDEEFFQLIMAFEAIGQEAVKFENERIVTVKEAEQLINAGYGSV